MNIDWEEVRNIAGFISAAIAAVLIAWAPVSCSKYTDTMINEAIQKGIDPADARCAYQGDTQNSNTCALRAAQQGTKK